MLLPRDTEPFKRREHLVDTSTSSIHRLSSSCWSLWKETKMGRAGLKLTAAAVLVLAASAANAHHSFAVFFDATKDISITGKVTAFRFTNPHGLVVLEVTDAQGRVREWRAETNSPSVLVRRGWTRDAIKPGDTVTIEGWPSRD